MSRSLIAQFAPGLFTRMALVGGVAAMTAACTVTSTPVPTPPVTAASGTDAGGAAPQADGGAVLALGFTPSNIDLTGLDLSGVGDVVISKTSCTFNSEVLESDCADYATMKFKVFTQPDHSKIGVYVARSFRIEPNAVVTVSGGSPIAFVALDRLEVLGGIVASGRGDVAVAGGFTQATVNTKGGGPGGGGTATTTVAAGGGSYCGIGGAGGAQSGTPSPRGAVYGTAEIVPLVGGSSGGAGTVAGAGAGGGAVQLVAGKSLSIPAGGYVHVGGGGGTFGGVTGQESAGGGSGGSILIEATTVTVAGTLAANGGGGGQGDGKSGIDAVASDEPAPGGNDPTSGGAGGSGSAGANSAGADGQNKTDTSSGGGGGGAGRIRINTKSGQAALTGAKVSPAPATSCATQGTLRP